MIFHARPYIINRYKIRPLCRFLSDFFNPAFFQTLGADPDPFMGPVHIGVDPLQVGIPSPSSPIICMADPITYQDTLAAKITTIGHKKILLVLKTASSLPYNNSRAVIFPMCHHVPAAS